MRINAQNHQIRQFFLTRIEIVDVSHFNGKSARNMEPGVHQASHKQAVSNKLR